ncbi:MAG: NADPH-dependent FMN reductase [Pirellulales bacterium]
MTAKVLGVAGSMREGSYSTRGIHLCLHVAAERGAETRLLDLRLAGLPMYQPDEAADDHVRVVAEAVQWADVFLLGTPDYHGSMSGAIKNFLDYHWAEFAGKLFGYVCASHEKGLTVMDHLRTAVRQCYGWSLPYGVSIHGEQDFDATGAIVNPRLAQRLNMLTRDLLVYGELLRVQFDRDLNDRERETFAARYGQRG